ncbi:unnamed protein product, partial [Laminaria digitata]
RHPQSLAPAPSRSEARPRAELRRHRAVVGHQPRRPAERPPTPHPGRARPRLGDLMIHVEHLQKRYGDQQAVQDLSFDVAPGALYAL